MRTPSVRAAMALITLFASLPARASGTADGFYRYPSIGGGTIVFASEGDLWKVPVGGRRRPSA